MLLGVVWVLLWFVDRREEGSELVSVEFPSVRPQNGLEPPKSLFRPLASIHPKNKANPGTPPLRTRHDVRRDVLVAAEAPRDDDRRRVERRALNFRERLVAAHGAGGGRGRL